MDLVASGAAAGAPVLLAGWLGGPGGPAAGGARARGAPPAPRPPARKIFPTLAGDFFPREASHLSFGSGAKKGGRPKPTPRSPRASYLGSQLEELGDAAGQVRAILGVGHRASQRRAALHHLPERAAIALLGARQLDDVRRLAGGELALTQPGDLLLLRLRKQELLRLGDDAQVALGGAAQVVTYHAGRVRAGEHLGGLAAVDDANAREDRAVVDDEVPADDAEPEQQELQRGVSRLAVADHDATVEGGGTVAEAAWLLDDAAAIDQAPERIAVACEQRDVAVPGRCGLEDAAQAVVQRGDAVVHVGVPDAAVAGGGDGTEMRARGEELGVAAVELLGAVAAEAVVQVVRDQRL